MKLYQNMPMQDQLYEGAHHGTARPCFSASTSLMDFSAISSFVPEGGVNCLKGRTLRLQAAPNHRNRSHKNRMLRGLATAPDDQSRHDGDMARSTYPSCCSSGALFTDVSSAQASVCTKSGEAGVANMEAAAVNRNTQGWGRSVAQPSPDA